MISSAVWRSCFFAGIVFLAAAAGLSAAPGDVRHSFAAPCKYPAGMATDGKHLFVADWRAALIQECALEDGKVGRTLDAPTLKPCGLAYADGRLYVCDDRTGWVFVLNLANGIDSHLSLTRRIIHHVPDGHSFSSSSFTPYIITNRSGKVLT